MREVTLVVGPPCAGKTTYVAERAADGDQVVDLDAIAIRLGSPSAHDHPERYRDAARAERARLEDEVAAMGSGRAWVVRTAADPVVRREIATRLGATRTVVLDPGRDEVIVRAYADGRPRWTGEAIDRWYAVPQTPA